MIPNTLFGLLAFAASVGPGYFYVRIAEKHKVRATRSSLLEVAELLSVGGFTSIVSGLGCLVVAENTDWIDLHAVANGAAIYLTVHPGRGLTFVLAVLAGSYALAGAMARYAHRRFPESITAGSVWSDILSDTSDRYVYGTAELRDGRAVYGQIAAFTLDEGTQERQIAFARPLKVKDLNGTWADVKQPHRIIVSDRDVGLLTVEYRPQLKSPAVHTGPVSRTKETLAKGLEALSKKLLAA